MRGDTTQIQALDGVISYSEAHVWQQTSSKLVGSIHVQVRPPNQNPPSVGYSGQPIRIPYLILAANQGVSKLLSVVLYLGRSEFFITNPWTLFISANQNLQ
jgi:hypothetical protein